MTKAEKFELFAALHRPGDPVVLYNAWDAGSAKAVAEAGAKAVATGVARISHGPFPYKLAMKALKEAAEAIYG
jgi:2-methylisocitrate lyase-like PEP mutase family enzyme